MAVTERVVLVREIAETDYSGGHSVKRLEHTVVEITWLIGKPKTPTSSAVGMWVISHAAVADVVGMVPDKAPCTCSPARRSRGDFREDVLGSSYHESTCARAFDPDEIPF